MNDLFSLFRPFPHIVADFSTRQSGNMKSSLEDKEEALRNQKAFFLSRGISSESVVGMSIVHGADVIRVGAREAGAVMKHADGLITAEPNVFLSATAADCLAIYFHDPQTNEIALVHAGWCGLARGILGKTLRQFIAPERVLVVIAPFIQSCHFEVGADLIQIFSAHPEAILERDGKTFVDLGAVALRQLLEAGVKSEYTEISQQCTACLPETYFSYRRDGEPLKAMIALLGIRSH